MSDHEAAVIRRYLVQVGGQSLAPAYLEAALRVALGGRATIAPAGSAAPAYFRLALSGTATLGDALLALARTGIAVLDCREDAGGVEHAFSPLPGGRP